MEEINRKKKCITTPANTIETKNLNGWIFGSRNSKMWMQQIFNKKHQFYNPIKQNRSHINYLNAYIYDSFPVYSIIVFSDRCTLKSVNVTSPDIKVINRFILFSPLFNLKLLQKFLF